MKTYSAKPLEVERKWYPKAKLSADWLLFALTF